MIGLLILLIASWILLWFTRQESLAVLGIIPTRDRVINLLIGLVLSALCFTIYCLTTTHLTNNIWAVNEEYSIKQLLSSMWWTIRSVLFEELVFRGALLYILIQKTGWKPACLFSAVAFGIYHWFSFGVIGNPIPMVYVFLSTGIWGLMFAYAFVKTKSLYLPTGLHLGWNLFNIVIFSQGLLGHQLLVNTENGQPVSGFLSLGLQVFQIAGLPIIIYFYLKRFRPTTRTK